MPFLGGTGLYDEILRVHPHMASHVVFLTGNADDPGVREFLRRTHRPVLIKPAELTDLVEAVRQVAAKPVAAAPARGGARILVADDDARLRNIVRRHLMAGGTMSSKRAMGRRRSRRCTTIRQSIS